MVDLYKNIEGLCKARGETITSMCKNAGISRSIMTELKMGRAKTLSYATMDKLATHFGVSINYIAYGNNDDIEPNNGEIDEFAYALYNETKGLTEEQKALLLQLAKQMNAKE